ncbi:MliC family protein [Dyella sedimenti]|uniref:MliC family protein n=1 Tax=Dyella sedimenti TaxID=2919947 RepID=UPI001FAAD742|nr:MliC family protein [Dyella sedimenti]
MRTDHHAWTAWCLLALAGCQSSDHEAAERAAASAPSTDKPAAATSAPAAPGVAAQATHVYAYQCGDLAVTGRFTLSQVTLSYAGKTLVLPQAMSASGARYADGQGNEFWGKGLKDATFTLAGEPARTCHGSGEELPDDAPHA